MLELSAFTPPMKVTFEGYMARRRTIGGYPVRLRRPPNKDRTLLIQLRPLASAIHIPELIDVGLRLLQMEWHLQAHEGRDLA